jgi:FtsP/CotA-like multicopper oxidase with cupredoxin domain
VTPKQPAMRRLSRRNLMLGALAAALPVPVLDSVAQDVALPPRLPPEANPSPKTHRLVFDAKERPRHILGLQGPEVPLWTYLDDPSQIVRMALGDTLEVTLNNHLPEHTSIHWHGVRVPNAMDGVQYLTQPPVKPGESFTYRFTPPDAGSFFFHPHCNESGQMGHGLIGLLIVEGDEIVASHAEVVLAVKDWRLDEAGQFLPFTTDMGAGRAGTFGTRRAVNAKHEETAIVPCYSDIRVRLYNVDSTRVMQVGIDRGEAAVIAIDGNPCSPFFLDKRGQDTWSLGPGQRIDLRVRSGGPRSAIRLIDYFGSEPWTIATLQGGQDNLESPDFNMTPLAITERPQPDLAHAERLSFSFSAASEAISAALEKFDPGDPLAQVMLDNLCVANKTFWAINKLPWPNDGHKNLPPPLYTLQAGKTYIGELSNTTPHNHPIHLHGMPFRVLSSSKRALPVHDADTVLLAPKERIEIAFVAVPGLWMLHCHILEHLEYGMMGYLKVV